MARTLSLPLEAVEAALRTLVVANLIAATERVVQVLPVPRADADQPAVPQTRLDPPKAPSPVPPPEPHPEPTEDEIRAYESQARAQIARCCGKHDPSPTVVRALARSLALKNIDQERP